jgi:hypothetical protein
VAKPGSCLGVKATDSGLTGALITRNSAAVSSNWDRQRSNQRGHYASRCSARPGAPGLGIGEKWFSGRCRPRRGSFAGRPAQNARQIRIEQTGGTDRRLVEKVAVRLFGPSDHISHIIKCDVWIESSSSSEGGPLLALMLVFAELYGEGHRRAA